MAEAVVSVKGISRWYGDVVAVNDISFDLAPGVTGLLGPNGAGKSTLLHMTAGFLRPSAGEVTIHGTSSWRHPEIFEKVGLVPEKEAVYPFLTAREFARLSAKLHGLADVEAAAERVIRLVSLENAADRPMRGYSKGMRQRAKIAASLVHRPDVLILDEPFNGTDPRQRLQLMDTLRALANDGCTVLFSSHILEEVERLADEVLVVVGGRLAASGNYRTIRRLMTDRPHSFMVRSSDNRKLAGALAATELVSALVFDDGYLEVRTGDYGEFTQALPGLVRGCGVTLFELRPADESLESVFSYLVAR